MVSNPPLAGGVVLNPAYYGMPGHTNIMVHEVGHVLGLYHVFKGVSERESCDDPCRETVPSMDTGDLCADTAPTPKSKLCQDPEPTNDTCGPSHFPGAPFSNYMSYTGTPAASRGSFWVRVAPEQVGAGRAEEQQEREARRVVSGQSCLSCSVFLTASSFLQFSEELKGTVRHSEGSLTQFSFTRD